MSISVTTPGPAPFAVSVEVSKDHPRGRLGDDVADALATAGSGDGGAQVWIIDVRDGDDEALAAHGLVPYRDLLQLRCELPVEPAGIETRPFDPDTDVQAFIEVNNRAFAWHPEQAGLTPERLAATMAEPWFDADGFRLHEIDDRLAGFCWTKIHPARPSQGEPELGEIYVIAVDPDFHGQRLGGPMTRAGLDWLADRGITTAMLYVEADNDAAVRTYERIGFFRHATNRAYRCDR
ncbi:MAG: mycothiol synthase [Acidimicrobiales bacterium]